MKKKILLLMVFVVLMSSAAFAQEDTPLITEEILIENLIKAFLENEPAIIDFDLNKQPLDDIVLIIKESYFKFCNHYSEYGSFVDTLKLKVYRNSSGNEQILLGLKTKKDNYLDEYDLLNQEILKLTDSWKLKWESEQHMEDGEYPKTKKEIAKFAHTWVSNHLTYTLNTNSTHSAYDAFIEKKGVCYHYSTIYNLILRNFEIEASGVVGYTANNQYHMWSRVTIDGETFLSDATYGEHYFIIPEDFHKELKSKYY